MAAGRNEGGHLHVIKLFELYIIKKKIKILYNILKMCYII